MRVLLEKPPRDLLEALVLRLFSLYENLLNMRLESRLPPVAPRSALGELRFVYSRCLQQGTRRGLVEPRILPVGKIVVPPRHLAFGIVSEKGL